MIEVYSAHITEVANFKEDLFNGLEFHDWNNQAKIDSPVFLKHNFTFPYYKDGVTTGPELLKNLLAIN